MLTRLLSSSKAALDLTSVMVGVIVIGLIGGVIATTLFVVVPWAQDNAAKASLQAIATAQSTYAGFQASEQSGTGSITNITPTVDVRTELEGIYTDYDTLVAEGLLASGTDTPLCSEAEDRASHWTASVISASGRSFYLTDTLKDPVEVADGQVTCFGLWEAPSKEYVTPPAPTTMTLNCDIDTEALLPFQNFTGSYAWSDGELGRVTASTLPAKTLTAGTRYTITLYGTFNRMGYLDVPTQNCITSMDAWNPEAGVTNLTGAFRNATKLTSVAEPPTTVTNMSYMFYGATSFNQNISTWDVSNVTNMRSTFAFASNFNQPLNDWNTSNVTITREMFYQASVFNQPLDAWDVSKVTNMQLMFRQATLFNQPLNTWNVSNVNNMQYLFYAARNFDQPLNNWDVTKVINMQYMFGGGSTTATTRFNQDITGWNTSAATTMSNMFQFNTSFNQNIANWDVSKVTNMTSMFRGATSFNQNISAWDVTNVTSWGSFRSTGCPLSTANTPAKFR